jgi:type I restriction enzyme M protein
MSNGSLSSNIGSEGEIRKNIIEADLVDCIVAMPTNLFLTTGIPVCLWFVSRNKTGKKIKTGGRNRSGETLFMDVSQFGDLETRTLRVLSGREEYPPSPGSDIGRIVRTYHAWRGETDAGQYADVPGFCKAASLGDIRKHGYALTPGRYVGATEPEQDGEPFGQKMQRLSAELRVHLAEADQLEAQIKSNLEALGYGK